jgi:hypothetical protein
MEKAKVGFGSELEKILTFPSFCFFLIGIYRKGPITVELIGKISPTSTYFMKQSAQNTCEREFEMVKRKVKIDDNSKITIRIPASFLEVFRAVYGCTTITKAIDSSSYRGQVSVLRDNLRMEAGIDIFYETIRAKHLPVHHNFFFFRMCSLFKWNITVCSVCKLCNTCSDN